MSNPTSRRARILALLASATCFVAAAPRGAQAIEPTTLDSALVQAVQTPNRFAVASAGIDLQRTVVASGPGWARQVLSGAAGSIAYTDAADYYFVKDLTGIDAVPLEQVVGAEFAAFVRARMRENALATPNPEERSYIVQRAALQAAEPLWLDRDEIELDPYAHLDIVICLPMPAIGGIVEPVFSPEIAIREISPGVMEFRDAAALATTAPLGTVDLRAGRSVAVNGTLGGAPTGAVAQSATAGGQSCFNLRDVLLAGEGDGTCKVDLLDPSTWYKEHDVTGRVDMALPALSYEFSVDSSEGLAAWTPLSTYFDGTLRFRKEYRFQNAAGRGTGGALKVRLGSFFCVPLWLRPTSGRMWAHAGVSTSLEVNATVTVPAGDMGQVTTVGEVADGTAGQLDVMRDSRAGVSPASTLPDPYSLLSESLVNPGAVIVVPMPPPIPILVVLDFPVEVGLDAALSSPSLTNFEFSSELGIGFDVECGFSGGCVEKEPFALTHDLDGALTGDSWVEGRGFVKPYVGMSLRVSLYLPGAIYAKIGPRVYGKLDLWAAVSGACGDADGNGSSEALNAVVLDGDVGLETVAEVGIFELLPSGSSVIDGLLAGTSKQWPFPDLSRNWHLFLAKEGSGADPFQPMLDAPTSLREDTTATLGARMRPCYPYEERVDYSLRFGDGGALSLSGAPDASTTASHAWANPGTYRSELVALRDAHGRDFAAAMGMTPQTSVKRDVVVTPTPVVRSASPLLRR